ncbi:hypothetical protein [Kosakonia arachidis]
MAQPELPDLDIFREDKRNLGACVCLSGLRGICHPYGRISEWAARKKMIESQVCFNRAGADCILTYFSTRVAALLIIRN